MCECVCVCVCVYYILYLFVEQSCCTVVHCLDHVYKLEVARWHTHFVELCRTPTVVFVFVMHCPQGDVCADVIVGELQGESNAFSTSSVASPVFYAKLITDTRKVYERKPTKHTCSESILIERSSEGWYCGATCQGYHPIQADMERRADDQAGVYLGHASYDGRETVIPCCTCKRRSGGFKTVK